MLKIIYLFTTWNAMPSKLWSIPACPRLLNTTAILVSLPSNESSSEGMDAPFGSGLATYAGHLLFW